MPHRRQMHRGSFGAHFDELVKHFPGHDRERGEPRHQRSSELQEKIDIHAQLFALAWEVDQDGMDSSGI
jgi:hypothetical protein